jgi:hypothetical protein
VKLIAEVNSHHATVLDDHEHRLQKIDEHSSEIGGLMSRTPRTPPAEIARLRALARGNKEMPAWREESRRHAEGVLVRQHEDLTPRMERLIRSLDITKAEAERRIDERERHYRACIMKIWQTE